MPDIFSLWTLVPIGIMSCQCQWRRFKTFDRWRCLFTLFRYPPFFACGSLENEVLQNSLDSLYANTQLVATHPYLLVQHYLPPNLLLKDVHHRLARASGKFSVLVNLIELIRDKKINVALISRAGKSFDLIESLLLGRMINYKRYSGTYLRQSSKSYKNILQFICFLPLNQNPLMLALKIRPCYCLWPHI